jgi:hypothetical protein
VTPIGQIVPDLGELSGMSLVRDDSWPLDPDSSDHTGRLQHSSQPLGVEKVGIATGFAGPGFEERVVLGRESGRLILSVAL